MTNKTDWMIPESVDRSLGGSRSRLLALADAYNSGWALSDGAYEAYKDVPGSTQTLRFDLEQVCRSVSEKSEAEK